MITVRPVPKLVMFPTDYIPEYFIPVIWGASHMPTVVPFLSPGYNNITTTDCS